MVGLGRSGLAAAEWLLSQEAEVTMFDESKSPVMQELAQKWQQRGASVVTGKAELGETRFVAAILSKTQGTVSQ